MKAWVLWVCWLLGAVSTGSCGAAAVESGPAESSQARAQARQQLQRIMNDPLFSRWRIRQQRSESQASEVWLDLSPYRDMIRQWANELGDWIQEVIDWISGHTPRAPTVPARGWGGLSLVGFLKILGWTALAVAGVVILWMIYGMTRQRWGAAVGAGGTRMQLNEALDRGEALAANSQQWMEHAGELAEEQDLRRAFRAMYLALLSGLHSEGKIQFRRQHTNWVYVGGYRGPDEERAVFRGLTARFDDVWYGLQQPEPGALTSLGAQVRQLLAGDPAATLGRDFGVKAS